MHIEKQITNTFQMSIFIKKFSYKIYSRHVIRQLKKFFESEIIFGQREPHFLGLSQNTYKMNAYSGDHLCIRQQLRNHCSIVTCGLKISTCASSGRGFAGRVPVVTRNTPLLWVWWSYWKHIHGNDILNRVLPRIWKTELFKEVISIPVA
jgi:hypothetical protein